MAVDLVFPLGDGSQWNNHELRYCLRSVEQYLKNYGNIYIVGNLPKFIKSDTVIHIPAKDSFHPSRNIMEKTLLACKESSLSSDFLFMNDDFYFIKEVDATKYPYYHKGDIIIAMEKNYGTGNWYYEYLKDTREVLLSKGLDVLNFDIHTPILYSKFLFSEKIPKFAWDSKKLIIKSLYCNSLEISGELREDVKTNNLMSIEELKEKLKVVDMFSSNRNIRPTVKNLIMNLFPNKSKYEI